MDVPFLLVGPVMPFRLVPPENNNNNKKSSGNFQYSKIVLPLRLYPPGDQLRDEVLGFVSTGELLNTQIFRDLFLRYHYTVY